MPEAGISIGGAMPDVEAAMDAPLATWRRWQQWAGVRDG